MKKLILFFLSIIFLTACVKETINLDKVSGQVGLDPGYVISAVKGDLNLEDLIEPDDTVFFDDLGLLTLVFREDSVINFGLSDFYGSFPDESYSQVLIVIPGENLVDESYIDLQPGNDIELREISVESGLVPYSISSGCIYETTVSVIFPSIDFAGSPLTESVVVPAMGTVSGNIDLTGTIVDLTTDPVQPYNRVPIRYTVSPGGVSSDPSGLVTVDVDLSEPSYNYIKGYFGQQNETIENDTIDLEMDDLFSKISGSFGFANPSIRINYRNSFGIPMNFAPEARGIKPGEEVLLNRLPEDLLHPMNVGDPEVQASHITDRSNSDLPELISMLPEKIIFGGTAAVNTLGDTGEDNFILSDSRFLADLEVEVPMELWINNLHLSDTVDNVFSGEEDEDSPIDMLSSLELRMYVENGFPLGGRFSITLYDSISATPMSVISSDELFSPAPVDANGVVTQAVENQSVIIMNEQFIEDAGIADKMIVSVTLYTSGEGTQDVKILSDYNFSFKVGLVVKADIETNLNE